MGRKTRAEGEGQGTATKDPSETSEDSEPKRRPGWPRGKPRKLATVTVHTESIRFGSLDLERMEAIRKAHPGLESDGDVVRHALEVAARAVGGP